MDVLVQVTLEPGAPWASTEVAPNGPSPRVGVNDRVVAAVAFDRGWPVRRTLDQIGAAIIQLSCSGPTTAIEGTAPGV